MNEIQRGAYDAGLWVGDNLVVPFLNGLMDSLEPQLVSRIQKVTQASMPAWMKRFL